MNTSYRVCRLGFWLFVPMHLGNFRNAFSVTIIRPCTIIMWTFVPWIEKWDRLFSILLVVRRSAATVCYACKTASLLHELRSDCNACVSASLALALCELCICLSVWTVLAILLCARVECIVCVCVCLCFLVKVFCLNFQLFCLCLLLLCKRAYEKCFNFFLT